MPRQPLPRGPPHRASLPGRHPRPIAPHPAVLRSPRPRPRRHPRGHRHRARSSGVPSCGPADGAGPDATPSLGRTGAGPVARPALRRTHPRPQRASSPRSSTGGRPTSPRLCPQRRRHRGAPPPRAHGTGPHDLRISLFRTDARSTALVRPRLIALAIIGAVGARGCAPMPTGGTILSRGASGAMRCDATPRTWSKVWSVLAGRARAIPSIEDSTPVGYRIGAHGHAALPGGDDTGRRRMTWQRICRGAARMGRRGRHRRAPRVPWWAARWARRARGRPATASTGPEWRGRSAAARLAWVGGDGIGGRRAWHGLRGRRRTWVGRDVLGESQRPRPARPRNGGGVA